ncbi:MAG TPA: hypothetical protein VEZ49_00740 [Gemmatimonadales bacterium]|nr:hypothetical protein [Gemmatimonadales bacterium]
MPALAQAPSKSRAVVMDQTTLPLPGVRVDMYRGDQIIQSTVTAGDGTFELLPGPATDLVEATLEGLKRSACRGAPPIASSWPSHTRPTSPR